MASYKRSSTLSVLAAVVGFIGLAVVIQTARFREDIAPWLLVCVSVVIFAACTAIVFRPAGGRNAYRYRQGLCMQCGYDLRGTESGGSYITCPECGHQKEETMPADACQFFYECENCKKVLKPKQGDCCVYCSYGTVACPPIQMNKDCC